MVQPIDALTDWLLAFSLVWIVWRLFRVVDLFASVVLYIVFGLLLSLVWVRLGAPDVALAEAAIGAGLTGALLLDAVVGLEGGTEPEGEQRGGALPLRKWKDRMAAAARALPVTLGALTLLGALLMVIPELLAASPGLAGLVGSALGDSGVTHPATAVLLNFRALDTLLEVGVLLVAAVAVLSLRGEYPLETGEAGPRDPVLGWLVRLLLPLIALGAGYVLWLGTHAPGGAFQSGALLASAAVLLILTDRLPRSMLRGDLQRIGLSLGLGTFLLAAILSLAASGALLRWRGAAGATVVLFVETAIALSVGITLATLFSGSRPRVTPERSTSRPR